MALAVYWRSNADPLGWYEHFVYQADAFLHGRLDLIGMPEFWLDYVVVNGKTYLPMPPGPALALLPLVATFGTVQALEAHAAIVLGALNVVLAYWMLGRAGASTRSALFGALLLGFSSVFWSAAALGTSWFFAHVVAVGAMLVGLAELAGKGRGWLVGLCFALAWLDRAPIVVAAPFILVFLWSARSRRHALVFALIALASVTAYGAFNFARFGDPLESGHHWQIAAAELPLAREKGLFALVHLPADAGSFLLRGFDIVESPPYFRPSPHGLSIVFTSPALLALLFPLKRPDRTNALLMVCAFAVLAPSLLWFSTGWVQWGYRYSLDALPLLVLAAVRAQQGAPRRMEWALLLVGITVNALGVYWVRTLGW